MAFLFSSLFSANPSACLIYPFSERFFFFHYVNAELLWLPCGAIGSGGWLQSGWPKTASRPAGHTTFGRTADFTSYFTTFTLDWTDSWITMSINGTTYSSCTYMHCPCDHLQHLCQY